MWIGAGVEGLTTMTSFAALALAASIACLIAWALTPYVARLATRVGAVDRPDGHRKTHVEAVPRAGGVVITIAAMVAVATAWLLLPTTSTSSTNWMFGGLLPAVVVLVIVGVIDDVLTLTGIYKLMGQVLAVSVLVAGGTNFDQISLFGFLVPLGSFSIPFTIFFCLGAINAFNLIDGADGLASAVGAIVCLTLGAITATRTDVSAALLCFALAGALFGFLRYNWPPARVYLGDTGSMLIGLVVAALAIHCSIKQQAAAALAVPIAVCAIPILDAGAALVRRITTGQSVFTADRGHLHHALLLRGWSVGATVAIIAGLAAITCGGALLSYFTSHDIFALTIAGGVFIALAAARIFGHAEAALILSRSRSLLRSAVSRTARRSAPDIESSIQLQGTRKWQKLWAAFREAAPSYNVCGLTLQIGIPHLHESFFANWKCKSTKTLEGAWQFTLPLTLENRPIGKLTLVGSSSGQDALLDMQRLLDYLESLHDQISEVALGQDDSIAGGYHSWANEHVAVLN
jgi:UDP-GlcNAc:undecaprenyl-phosphate/decaprenyl-phosphate GlcNAc-1-phosphate transferase